MPELSPLPITPPPGVVKTESKRVVEGRWIDCDKMRSRRGKPEVLGGWTRVTTTQSDGLPRTMFGWRDLSANEYIAVGTYKKLYVYDTNLAQNDVTPFRLTGTLGSNPITTTSGSKDVTIAHTANGLSSGDIVILAGATAVGGLTMNGTFQVKTAAVNSYVVTAASTASSGATGGGSSVTYKYEVPVGTELSVAGLGWGVGGWGIGTWGTARTNSTIVFEPRVWALDAFGKILLAAYNGGTLYTFDPSASQPWGRAQVISGAPTNIRSMFVTPERFVFTLCEGMTVNACSQADYTIWTPADNNTAFSRTLSKGTRLVAGRVLTDFISMVWSDSAIYRFQYTGSQYVYNSSLVAENCGLVGPNAVTTINGAAYWMGADNLWMFNGSVVQIPNAEDIRRFLYDDLPSDASFQCFAVFNPRYNEIYFGYAGTGDTHPTKYVIFNLDDNSWMPGTLTRVSGMHFTQGDTRPYFADVDGYIYQHETSVNANGSPMNPSITLSPYAMQEGLTSMDVESILHDFFDQQGDVMATVNTYDRLTDAAPMDSETETIPAADAGITDYRVSGRYIGITYSQSELNAWFRVGKPVAFVKPTATRT